MGGDGRERARGLIRTKEADCAFFSGNACRQQLDAAAPPLRSWTIARDLNCRCFVNSQRRAYVPRPRRPCQTAILGHPSSQGCKASLAEVVSMPSAEIGGSRAAAPDRSIYPLQRSRLITRHAADVDHPRGGPTGANPPAVVVPLGRSACIWRRCWNRRLQAGVNNCRQPDFRSTGTEASRKQQWRHSARLRQALEVPNRLFRTRIDQPDPGRSAPRAPPRQPSGLRHSRRRCEPRDRAARPELRRVRH